MKHRFFTDFKKIGMANNSVNKTWKAGPYVPRWLRDMVKDTDTENIVLKTSGAAVWTLEVIVHRNIL